ncbi:hypothetical protein FB446DRAFT_794923 [Lentinula raphanica]|nr:hypothetical protein FB446DRAFT_794923 [Lentinula raphanica]
MADLNPAPGGGRRDPPPLGNLDRAPAGSFQANCTPNGELGVAARRRARLHLSTSSVPQGQSREPSPFTGWDTDAFPAEHDLFGTSLGGQGNVGAFSQNANGGQSPSAVSSHSSRICQELEQEGGGTVPLRGRGPIPPVSPGSDSGGAVAACGTVGALGRLVPTCHIVLSCVGAFGFPPLSVPRDAWCPFGHVCFLGLLVPMLSCLPVWRSDAGSDLSEWGGIDGEFRFEPPPALGPPIELRLERQAPRPEAEPHQLDWDGAEQFRAGAQPRLPVVPSPRRITSMEDGGRAAVRYGDHTQRRSRSAEPMNVDPVLASSSRSRIEPLI